MGAKHMRFVRWLRPLFSRRRRRRRGAIKQHASVGCVQLMPLPRLQTTWRRPPHFTSRSRWRVARLMLRASVGRAARCRARKRRGGRSSRSFKKKRWRVARLMLRAGVGRVQLMPRPHAQMCVEWSVCAAAEPADDAAAALDEQKKVASREADAARRGVRRVQLMPPPRSDVRGMVCVRHDV